MHAESSATTSWEGTLAHGSGQTTLASGVAGPLAVSWAHRTERSAGTHQPRGADRRGARELLRDGVLARACRGGCHTRASRRLGDGHVRDRRRRAEHHAQSRSRCAARSGGIDADGFAKVAAAAKDGCPVSRALKGNVEITLDAALA